MQSPERALAIRPPALEVSAALFDRATTAPGRVHPRFVEILGRFRGIGEDYFSLARRDPGYLTDLRAKRHDEPRHFFAANAQLLLKDDPEFLLGFATCGDACTEDLAMRLGVGSPGHPRFDQRAMVRSIGVESPATVAHMMGFYVNSLGSWEDAVELASAVVEYASALPRNRDAGRLLESSGQALAVGAEDRRARQAWDRAAVALPPGYDRFFLSMRVAAAELKRFADFSRAEKAVRTAAEEADALADHGHAPGDCQFAQALVLNFQALIDLINDDLSSAGDRVEKAWGMIGELSSADLTLEPATANRYRVMVLENRGLLSVRRGLWGDAYRVFAEATALARACAPDSLAETLSLAACVRLRERKFADARQMLEEAADLLAADTRPGAYESVCRMLALACDEQGDSDAAAGWLDRAREHPTGPGWRGKDVRR